VTLVSKIEPDADGAVQYRVGDFVEDAFAVKITPFMLDTFAHEYEEIVRARDAHAIELDGLRKANRALSTQVSEFSYRPVLCLIPTDRPQ
jgi:ecotropic viral integration site 5 protein